MFRTTEVQSCIFSCQNCVGFGQGIQKGIVVTKELFALCILLSAHLYMFIMFGFPGRGCSGGAGGAGMGLEWVGAGWGNSQPNFSIMVVTLLMRW